MFSRQSRRFSDSGLVAPGVMRQKQRDPSRLQVEWLSVDFCNLNNDFPENKNNNRIKYQQGNLIS